MGVSDSIAVAYVLFPELFMWPFSAKADPVTFSQLEGTIKVLLRFITVYCLFDTMNIVCASGIKGAGDTRYVMMIVFVASLFLLALPTYIALIIFNRGLYTAWTIITIYIIIVSLIFLFRFLGGKWKSMRVIETLDDFLRDSVVRSRS